MPHIPSPVIYWNRRDFRIADNPGLALAAGSGRPVIPVCFLSKWKGLHAWTGAKRQQFLCNCLISHARDLAAIGGRLVIRHDDPVAGLRELIKESGAGAVHFNQDPDPYGRAVEGRVREMCESLGVACTGHPNALLHGPDEVLTGDGKPYRVFTPYSRNWLKISKPDPIPGPSRLRTPKNIPSQPLPTLKHWGLRAPDTTILPEAGESAARARLAEALASKLRHYADRRDFPAEAATSRLSQDLRFGLISIRTVHAEAWKARAKATPAARVGIDAFIRQLAWRDFYLAILHHFPNVLDEEFHADWRGLPWAEPDAKFEAWKLGMTGFPIVDAGMRELLATGYMHNRVRMITAMFLTKDLHLDWKLGESHFMQHLIDGEIALNNGGWQWSAGTGADAAPYFRIQNPWSQTVRYDPDGRYIQQWVPELANVPPERFMKPPPDGKPLAAGYPSPCVHHHAERETTLAIFARHRQQRRTS